MPVTDYVREGREVRSGGRALVLTGAEQQLVGPSPLRWGIVVTPPAGGSVTLTPETVAAVGSRVVLVAGDPPLHLTVWEWGDLVTRPWQVIGSDLDAPLPELGVTSRWQEAANAVNAVATADHAAVAGSLHVITDLLAGYSTVTATGTLNFRRAAVNQGSGICAPQVALSLVRGFLGVRGESVGVELGAGGVGVTGRVLIQGYTVGAREIYVIEQFLPA